MTATEPLQKSLAGVLPSSASDTAAIRARRLALAEWNLREAVCRASIGDDEESEYHLDACREVLALVTGRMHRRDVDALRFAIQSELDK